MFKTKMVLISVCALLASIVSAPSVSALFVNLSQPIDARYCTLTTIFDANGKATYTISPRCGKLMPNLDTKQATGNTANNRLAFGRDNALAELFYGGERGVYLESDPSIQPDDGYMLFAKQGSIYTFYLGGDTPDGPKRSFEIVDVQDDRVALQFWPGGKVVWVALDERMELNLAYGSDTDAVLRLIRIRDDGTVLLHISFPEQARAQSDIAKKEATFTAVAIGATTVAFLLNQFIYKSLLVKYTLPKSDWWVEHPHDPFK